MSDRTEEIVGLIARWLIGLTFIASGIGKLLGELEAPAQAMAFVNAVLPAALLTPLVVGFLYKVLVPILFPLAELVIGIALVAGLLPRIAAVLTLLMVAAFMGINIWTIATGEFSQCASCFGIWEKIFGHLTPYQSLGIDIILGLLAICVLVLRPRGFLTNQWPASFLAGRLLPGQRQEDKAAVAVADDLKASDLPVFQPDNPVRYTAGRIISIAGYFAGVIGLILIVVAFIMTASAADVNTGLTGSKLLLSDNITVTELTTGSGNVNFITDSFATVEVLVYDKNGKITGIFPESSPERFHAIRIDNLAPATTYYFQLLYGDPSAGKSISAKYSFTTLEPPPVILNVRILRTTDSAAWLAWETDRITKGKVTFREDGKAESYTVSENASSTMHEVMLQPLSRERIYVFEISVEDVYGHRLIAEYEGILSFGSPAQLTRRAPDIVLPTVTGGTLDLSQYRGKVILLAFWNMTCPTCQKKMPLLQSAFDRMGNSNFKIITVHGPGREEAIKSYCSSQGLTLPVLLDLQGDTGSAYNVFHLPATFILDQSGVIRSTDAKFETAEELDALIKKYLPR
jgi:peroxiredoxin/uncharacterized membrane protein YphA (DoxX/SURF4 family)